jgi:hypothetical protein
MTRGTPLSEHVIIALCAARETGAPIDECGRVARVPIDTLNTWLRLGRAYLEADPSDRVASHEVYADLRQRMDEAHGRVRQELRRSILAAKGDDPRLTLDYLKWLEGTETRRAALVKTKAEAAAAKAAAKAIGAAESITLTLPASVSTPRTDGADT